MIKSIIIKYVGWLNYKFQSKRNISNCYITYSGGWDGACAQAHAIISILLFAEKFKIKYLHTAFTNIEHYYDDRAIWSKEWEVFFSLGNGEMSTDAIDRKDLSIKNIKYPSLIHKQKNTMYFVRNCHSFTDFFSSDYTQFQDSLRKKYQINKKIAGEQRKDVVTIALHIRRGDVSASNKNSARYTNNAFLVEKLKIITGSLNFSKQIYQIHIFSQGSENDFNEFKDFAPVLKLNENEFETFDSLVSADILIMAKSSFSYVAALLNTGIIFYEPFWHKPLEKWIDISNSNDLFVKEFNLQLKSKNNY